MRTLSFDDRYINAAGINWKCIVQVGGARGTPIGKLSDRSYWARPAIQGRYPGIKGFFFSDSTPKNVIEAHAQECLNQWQKKQTV